MTLRILELQSDSDKLCMMDKKLAVIQGVIAEIDSASLQPHLWPRALRAIANAVGGVAPGLAYQANMRDAAVALDVSPRFLELRWELYRAHGSPMYGLKPGCVASMRNLFKDSLHRSEWFNEWARPQDFIDSITGKITGVGARCSVVGVFRAGCGLFNDHEIEVFATLLPHVQRALRLQLHIERAKLDGILTAVGLLNRNLGMLVLDESGSVLTMNVGAENIVRQADGIVVQTGKVRALHPPANRRLQRAIDAVVADEPVDAADTVIRIHRPSGCMPLEVIITRPEVFMPSWLACRPAALIFVTDPNTTPDLVRQHLEVLYDLTTAEARIAEALVSNCSPKQTAAKLGVQVNTVRFHLKSIFAKTATRNQAELVRLLLSGLACLPSFQL